MTEYVNKPINLSKINVSKGEDWNILTSKISKWAYLYVNRDFSLYHYIVLKIIKIGRNAETLLLGNLIY